MSKSGLRKHGFAQVEWHQDVPWLFVSVYVETGQGPVPLSLGVRLDDKIRIFVADPRQRKHDYWKPYRDDRRAKASRRTLTQAVKELAQWAKGDSQ